MESYSIIARQEFIVTSFGVRCSPPPLLILNEPEASLHADLIAPLAELIAKASRDSQILVVSHYKPLVEAIKEHCEAKVVDLISFEG